MALASILGVSNPFKIGGVQNYARVFGDTIPGGSVPQGPLSVLSSFDKSGNITLSGGNLTYTAPSGNAGCYSTASYTSGKREYWVFNDMETAMLVGVCTNEANVSTWVGNNAFTVGVWSSNGAIYSNGSTSQSIGAIADQTWVGIRHDADTGEVWFKRDADPSWTLSTATLPTGAVYHAIVGTGSTGSANTATVEFDPANFPETIGVGFEPLREPLRATYTPTLLHDNRFDDDTKIDPTWTKYGWVAASDTFSMLARFGKTSGKYEYWAQRPNVANTLNTMTGFGTASITKSQYPGQSSHGSAVYYNNGTFYTNGSNNGGTENVGAVGLTTYVGHRIDIGLQKIEYTADNGSTWVEHTNAHADIWTGGAIYPLVGVSNGGILTHDPADWVPVIFDPANFPVAISAGYSPFAA